MSNFLDVFLEKISLSNWSRNPLKTMLITLTVAHFVARAKRKSNRSRFLILPSKRSSRINGVIVWNGSAVNGRIPNGSWRKAGQVDHSYRSLLIIAEERQKWYLIASDKRPLPGMRSQSCLLTRSTPETGKRNSRATLIDPRNEF
jgi:hypothetical protein